MGATGGVKTDKVTATLDDAMLLTGFGMYNVVNMLLSGFILLGMIMETLGLSFIIPGAQCDLELTQTQKGWLAAIPFIGIILTSHAWGWLADTRGRRAVMLVSMATSSLFSIVSSFSPNLLTFAALRFIASLFISGPSGVAYAYLGEFNSARHRDKMVAFGAAFVGIGTVTLPAMAWLILPLDFALPIPWLGIEYRSWRLMVVACTIPYAICAFAMLLASESPKFLHASGRSEDCLKIVKRIYVLNKRKHEDTFPVTMLISESRDEEESGGKGFPAVLRSMRDQTLPLFRAPLLGWTCLSCFVQFGIFATANGFYIWFPTILNEMANHAENVGESASICAVLTATHESANGTALICDDSVNVTTYSTAITIGLVFSAVYLAMGAVVDLLGKRTILVFMLALSGSCGIAAHLVEQQGAAIALFGMFQICGACIGLLTAVVVDLFPTRLRAMAVCLSLMMGRVGSVVGTNIIGVLLKTACGVSFYLFGSLLILCSFLCLTLPGKKVIKDPVHLTPAVAQPHIC